MKINRMTFPSLFTVANFLFGFLSIIKSLEGNIHGSAWFIILAILCDGMDGKIARWTSSETPFGFELDSFGDLLSAGIAPAVLLYAASLNELGTFGFLLCFLYVLCGGYRLARFNVIQAGDRSKGYIGLPIPVAGLTISAFWISPVSSNTTTHPSVGLTVSVIMLIVLSVMMVCRIPYAWPRIEFQGGWKQILRSTGILVAVGLMAAIPRLSLFPLVVLYIILGIVGWLVQLFRGEVSGHDFFLTLRDSG